MTSLSDAAAEALSKHEGELQFRGLNNLSDVADKALSKQKAKVSLSDKVNTFTVVGASSDEWDFSDCSSTEDIISSLESYIDHLIEHNDIPAVTFIDEAGKKKIAVFASRDGISIEDADDDEAEE